MNIKMAEQDKNKAVALAQNCDPELIEMLRRNLKRAKYKQMSANINELKQHSKEARAKPPPQQCVR